jgi:hypothetical protein
MRLGELRLKVRNLQLWSIGYGITTTAQTRRTVINSEAQVAVSQTAGLKWRTKVGAASLMNCKG